MHWTSLLDKILVSTPVLPPIAPEIHVLEEVKATLKGLPCEFEYGLAPHEGIERLKWIRLKIHVGDYPYFFAVNVELKRRFYLWGDWQFKLIADADEASFRERGTVPLSRLKKTIMEWVAHVIITVREFRSENPFQQIDPSLYPYPLDEVLDSISAFQKFRVHLQSTRVWRVYLDFRMGEMKMILLDPKDKEYVFLFSSRLSEMDLTLRVLPTIQNYKG